MAVTVRRRTQEERREESERRLMDALVAIVNRDGIQAATCENIGLEAGYSRGLITQRLGKRDEMFATLIARLVAAQRERVARPEFSRLGGAERIRAYIDLHFSDLSDNPGYRAYFVLLAGSITDVSLLREPVVKAHKFVLDLLVKCIRKGQEDGELDPAVEPFKKAVALGTYLLGVAIQYRLQPRSKFGLLKEGAYELIPYRRV